MDHDDCAHWKLNQIERVLSRAWDPWLGEAIEVIETILKMSDEEVETRVLSGERIPLEAPYFRQ